MTLQWKRTESASLEVKDRGLLIARALLYGKKLLLVDEATSALDTRMATEVENNLL